MLIKRTFCWRTQMEGTCFSPLPTCGANVSEQQMCWTNQRHPPDYLAGNMYHFESSYNAPPCPRGFRHHLPHWQANYSFQLYVKERAPSRTSRGARGRSRDLLIDSRPIMLPNCEILKCDWSGLEELEIFYCPTTQEDFYLFSNITNLASTMVQLSNICDS